MGTAEALGYRLSEPNGFQRAMRRVASSRAGAWLFSRIMPSIDRVLLRATGGRLALPAVAAGIPVVTLITTGAKTGSPRSTPLLAIPHSEDLAVIGTQFGQPGTPSWYYNLKADPRAEIVYRDKRVQVVAAEAEGGEWQLIWDRARAFYPGYDAYAARIHGRPIHIMVLTQASRS